MANEARYESSDYHRPLPDGSSVPQRRPDKTVCQAHQGQYPNAIKLLKKGFRRGMVSVQRRGEWPRNVWAVDANGMAYEAQLTNQDSGQYHGYPMRETAAFTRHVLAEWKKRG